MTDNFYRAFEDSHRGSWDDIRQGFTAYQPLLQALHRSLKGGQALDLGCGRGEWLDQLQASGFQARGVDQDDAMLAECRQRHLTVATGDAVTDLAGQPDHSHALISALHVAEHLPFHQLEHLVGEALRVLQPGGVLILETPNPENLTVGSCSFYLDPTHQRPLPPQLLAFLARFHGFAQVVIWRLHEAARFQENAQPGILGVLGGVSPDYALIAQKGGDDTLLEALRPLLLQEHGQTLETLGQRYEAQQSSGFEFLGHQIKSGADRLEGALERRLHEQVAGFDYLGNTLNAGISRLELRLTEQYSELLARLQVVEQCDLRIQSTLAETLEPIHQQLAQAQQRTAAAESALLALRNSYSWRITAPLRDLLRAAQWLLAQGRPHAWRGLQAARLWLGQQERFLNWGGGLVRRLGLEQHLLPWLRRHLLPSHPPTPQPPFPEADPSGLEHLTPQARHIYRQLTDSTDAK